MADPLYHSSSTRALIAASDRVVERSREVVAHAATLSRYLDVLLQRTPPKVMNVVPLSAAFD